ncbi:MAG: peptidoglycan DD-metalloendopeptidase family protein [Oligoflexia bacterium]|nr:peptidoglycan DD-metalloendopeptidase family protein [Oligoflexia bacterium]
MSRIRMLAVVGAVWLGPTLGLGSWAPTAHAQAASQDASDATRIDERGILDQLNTLDRELQQVRDQREAAQDRLTTLQESTRKHDDEAASASAQLQAQRPGAVKLLHAIYRLHRRGLARIIFGADDPTDLRRLAHYLQAILQADLDRMHQFSDVVTERTATRQSLEKDIASMTALRAELQLREAELRDQRARRLAMLDNIRSRRSLALRARSEYGQVGRRLDGRLTALDSNSDAIREQVRTINPEANFRALFGHLPWPTTGHLIRRFGPYSDPSNGGSFDSLGIEISADYGTPFRAVFDGTVKLADFMPGYGQTVAIEHGPYTTVYSHAKSLRVRRGDHVRAGDILGMVGNTGLTDGNGDVLGFEIRYNGSPQDPLPWLASR